MDRNSVLAFLLIAIIILLMPEYYKMVYPDAQLSDSTETIINQNSTTQPDKTPPPSLEELEIDNDEEFISFDVQTNLYKATISNENVGDWENTRNQISCGFDAITSEIDNECEYGGGRSSDNYGQALHPLKFVIKVADMTNFL